MNPLTRAAVVGTARAPAPELPPGDAAALIAAREPLSQERRLLLAAGIRGVCRLAGRLADTLPDAIPSLPPAPVEAEATCAPAVSRLLVTLATGPHVALLPEALARLARTGHRLAPQTLPVLLDVPEAHREALRPVLGARGRWLAAQQERWRWAVAPAPVDEGPPTLSADRLAEAQQCLYLATGRLRVRFPDALAPGWAAHGVHDRAPERLGPKAWWVVQLVACVPPDAWTARFERGPQEVIAAVSAEDGFVIEGLVRAALGFGATGWFSPLWTWLATQVGQGFALDPEVHALWLALLSRLPKDEGERAAVDIIDKLASGGRVPLDEVLCSLQRPWSVWFARYWLGALDAHLRGLGEEGAPDAVAWVRSVPVAARSLPRAVFSEARPPWPAPQPESWRLEQWRIQREAFEATIRIRRRLAEVIPR